MLYLHIAVHILETVITDGMHTRPIINTASLPCTYLQKAEVAERTGLTGVCFCFLNGNKVAGTTLMMSPTVRDVLRVCLPFCKVWIAAISPCCWCCSSVSGSPGPTCLLMLLPQHHFRNLMNCTNLRLTSNPPVFLFPQSQTVAGGESCTHTPGTRELPCMNTLTHTHAQWSEVAHWQGYREV